VRPLDPNRGSDVALLRQVTDAAAQVFSRPGRRVAAAIYLRQRGIEAKHLSSDWLLGYAPPGWTRLVDELRHDFDDQALVDAGVARRSSRGSLIDTFRDRVIFGIRGADGQLAGFTARDLSGDAHAPKYLNTHRHDLFDKSALLYGLHEGRTGEAHQPVIVEGPLDVLAIAARDRGARDRGSGATGLLPVAPCGTAFTLTHARRVAEIAFAHQAPVVIAMDGDSTGRAAALTAGETLRYVGLDVRVAVLANGLDPAEYLNRADANLDTFRPGDGLPLLTVHVEKTIADQGDRMQWIEGRLAAARAIASYLATYPASHSARQIGWLADALHLDAATVTFELAEAYRAPTRTTPNRCSDMVRMPPARLGR